MSCPVIQKGKIDVATHKRLLKISWNLSYSSETIYNYERDLKVLEQFLEECQFDFDRLDKKAILQHKAYLASRDRETLAKAEPGEKCWTLAR